MEQVPLHSQPKTMHNFCCGKDLQTFQGMIIRCWNVWSFWVIVWSSPEIASFSGAIWWVFSGWKKPMPSVFRTFGEDSSMKSPANWLWGPCELSLCPCSPYCVVSWQKSWTGAQQTTPISINPWCNKTWKSWETLWNQGSRLGKSYHNHMIPLNDSEVFGSSWVQLLFDQIQDEWVKNLHSTSGLLHGSYSTKEKNYGSAISAVWSNTIPLLYISQATWHTLTHEYQLRSSSKYPTFDHILQTGSVIFWKPLELKDFTMCSWQSSSRLRPLLPPKTVAVGPSSTGLSRIKSLYCGRLLYFLAQNSHGKLRIIPSVVKHENLELRILQFAARPLRTCPTSMGRRTWTSSQTLKEWSIYPHLPQKINQM